jgi:hypothetical protein
MNFSWADPLNQTPGSAEMRSHLERTIGKDIISSRFRRELER